MLVVEHFDDDHDHYGYGQSNCVDQNKIKHAVHGLSIITLFLGALDVMVCIHSLTLI
jgi:hypothetical protein